VHSRVACTQTHGKTNKHTKRQYEEEDNVKAKGNNTKRTRKNVRRKDNLEEVGEKKSKQGRRRLRRR
jgi:hypothetical protein